MAAYDVTVTFEMTDGRTLSCEYGLSVTPGNYSGLPENCYPDECDLGDPTYYIDGDEIAYEDLPKGLDKIADAMYEDGQSDRRFKYVESENEPDFDYEPDYDPY